MKHHKHRKLFFSFGMLSLALLPLLGFHKIAEIYRSRTAPLHCIELAFPTSDSGWGENTGKKFSEMRKYKSFVLTADTLQNNIILNESRKLLNEIKESLDTVNGIHIIFSDSTKYKDYIKTLDYSMEEFPGAFIGYKNNFWPYYVDIDTAGTPKKILDEWKKRYKRINCRKSDKERKGPPIDLSL